MTGPLLLGYIVAAVVFQLAAAITVASLRRRWAAPDLAAAATQFLQPAATAAWAGWRPFRVERRTPEDIDGTQCSFHLTPVDGVPLPPFEPGQFLTFSLKIPGGVPVIRCYSLSDRPNPASYRVTVKRALAPAGRPDLLPGIASSYFHDQVHEGDILELKAPAGQFTIDPDPIVPVVFLCGGIGITPMMSMLLWCLDEQPNRTIHLYYGIRQGGEHAFKQPLEALAAAHPNFHLTVLYSRPCPTDVQGRDYQQAGRLEIELLRRALPHGRHRFYVCGPPAMMETLVPGLKAWGVLPGDIHHEAFGPASLRSITDASPDIVHDAVAPLNISFRRSGRTLIWDGQDANLLDFAERHGVPIEAGCRSGSCGSCETAITFGTVSYRQKPDHDPAPGYCLMCVGLPDSAVVLEA